MNCQLHQIIVARFADENLIIDFDNFVRCLIRLETLFSEYRFKSQTLLLFLFTARLLDAESYFRSTFVSITDRIITNVQSLLLPTWQVVLVHYLADTISLSLMGCLHSGTFFFNLGVKCVVINSSLSWSMGKRKSSQLDPIFIFLHHLSHSTEMFRKLDTEKTGTIELNLINVSSVSSKRFFSYLWGTGS